MYVQSMMVEVCFKCMYTDIELFTELGDILQLNFESCLFKDFDFSMKVKKQIHFWDGIFKSLVHYLALPFCNIVQLTSDRFWKKDAADQLCRLF